MPPGRRVAQADGEFNLESRACNNLAWKETRTRIFLLMRDGPTARPGYPR